MRRVKDGIELINNTKLHAIMRRVKDGLDLINNAKLPTKTHYVKYLSKVKRKRLITIYTVAIHTMFM